MNSIIDSIGKNYLDIVMLNMITPTLLLPANPLLLPYQQVIPDPHQDADHLNQEQIIWLMALITIRIHIGW